MKYPIIPFFFILLAISTNAQQQLSQLSYPELDSLVLIEYSNGTFDKAIPYTQAARDKAQKEFGEMDSVYAEYTHNLGVCYHQIGMYQEAENFCLQAIAIYEKIFGEYHHSLGTSLNSLASLFQDMGRYDQAEKIYLRAKNIHEKTRGKLHPDYAMIINDLGQLYYSIGSYEKAEILFSQSKKIYEQTLGEEHPYFAMSLNNLAMLYVDMGSYDLAEPLLLHAKNVYAKVVGEDHPDFANALNNLAALYHKMEQYSKSEPIWLEAIAIWRKVLGEEHPYLATSFSNLAALYDVMLQFEKAEQLYLKALEIQRKVMGEQHSTYAITLYNLASLYQKMKEYTKAEALFLQAVNIRKKVFGEKNALTAVAFNNLTAFYLHVRKLDTALQYCQLGIAANSAEIDKNFKDWSQLDKFQYYSKTQINISIQHLLGILETQYSNTKEKSKLEEIYQAVQSAMRLNEQFRNSFSGEGDKLRLLAANSGYVIKSIWLGLHLDKEGHSKASFSFAETNKGALLMDAAKTANAYQFGDLPDSLAKKEKSLQKKYSDLQANLLESRPQIEKDSLRGILTKLNEEINSFTKNLKSNYPKYAAIKYENKTAKVEEIQALLDDKTAIIEYVMGEDHLFAFYLDKNKIVLKEINISVPTLHANIKILQNTLSDYKTLVSSEKTSYHQYKEQAYWFYENMFSPVLQNNKNKNIKNLIIIPDGELGHIPFEVFLTKLVSSQEKNYAELPYLGLDYAISYNYSASLWKESKEKKSRVNNGLLFALAADYEIRLDSTKSAWRLNTYQRQRSTLSPLPSARNEVKTLSEIFNGFFAFDKDASEKNFKEKAGDYAIIHLAMHGLLDAKNPILSSLAFTEDGDSLENNFLQAYEISKMKLNADLVVLSACETGYGRFEKGNGIASLAQAFAYAGAPAMIVSLWQVNDFATSEIMKNLYQNLANGMPKDEALQQAKLKYIKEAQGIAAHPAFWSPFILMGNTDAIELKQKSNYFWWGILGSLALLVVVLGWSKFQNHKRTKQ